MDLRRRSPLNLYLKYKLRKDLNIYHKGMIESTFVKSINKKKYGGRLHLQTT